jgi:hypothetical protein
LEDGDTLPTAKAIWRFRNQPLGTNTSLSATQKHLLNKQIPEKKTPSGWIGSKRRLSRFYADGNRRQG